MSKYGEKFWQNLIHEWVESDLNLSQFCREKGVSPTSFKIWRNKFPELLSNTQKARIKRNEFIEVQEAPEPLIKMSEPLIGMKKEERDPPRYLIVRSSHGYTVEIPL